MSIELMLERIAAALEKLAAAKTVPVANPAPYEPEIAPPVFEAQGEAIAEDKPKRGRKPKAEETAVAEATVEDAREALKGYAITKGADKAKALLGEFKAAKLSELNGEQRFHLISAIKKEV